MMALNKTCRSAVYLLPSRMTGQRLAARGRQAHSILCALWEKGCRYSVITCAGAPVMSQEAF